MHWADFILGLLSGMWISVIVAFLKVKHLQKHGSKQFPRTPR